MRKYIFIISLIFLTYTSFGQDLSTLIKLHEISSVLGIINNLPADSSSLKAKNEKIKKKDAEQQMYLLRAAQFYKDSDFESSIFYILKVKDFESIDLNNLKYVILVGSYANLKDFKNTIKWHYKAKKKIDPVNLRKVNKEIIKNFNKSDFDEGIKDSPYNEDDVKDIKYN